MAFVKYSSQALPAPRPLFCSGVNFGGTQAWGLGAESSGQHYTLRQARPICCEGIDGHEERAFSLTQNISSKLNPLSSPFAEDDPRLPALEGWLHL